MVVTDTVKVIQQPTQIAAKQMPIKTIPTPTVAVESKKKVKPIVLDPEIDSLKDAAADKIKDQAKDQLKGFLK